MFRYLLAPIKGLYTIVSVFTGEYEMQKSADARDELAAVAGKVSAVLDRKLPPVPPELREAFLRTAEHIVRTEFADKRFYDSPSFQPATIAEYPSLLRKAYEAEDLASLFVEPLLSACQSFELTLPQYVKEPGIASVRLKECLSEYAFYHFACMLEPQRLFYDTIQQERSARYRLADRVSEKLAAGGPAETFDEMTGLPLFAAFKRVMVPIAIPRQLRFEGTWIVAPSGRGKTTLLSRMLDIDLDAVKAGKGSVILMDSKGELTANAMKLARFGPGGDLEGKLVLIEPTRDLALNPLDLGGTAGHSLELTEYLLDGLLDTATTPKQGGVFRRVLIAMKAIPGATFQTFIEFLNDWKPFEEQLRALEPDDLTFFTSGKYDEKDFRSTRNELYWRIDALMTKVPLMRSMFKAPKTLLDLGAEMDAGKVIIIDNRESKLSAGLQFYSRFFVSLILAAAQRRAMRDSDKLPCYVYIDECHDVIANEPKVARILHQCRAQKIALILAHQSIKQLASDEVRDAVANCAVRFASPDKDASALADDFRTDKETLQGLRRGQFALYMRDLTKRPLVLDIPNNPVAAWPKMTAAQFEGIQAGMRARFCYRMAADPAPLPPDPDTAPEKWGE